MNIRFSLAIAAVAFASGCDITGAGGPSSSIAGNAPGALAFEKSPDFASNLDRKSRAALYRAETRALDFAKPGNPVRWRGTADVSGSVSVSPPFKVAGRECRRFRHTVEGAGPSATLDATACRSAESWALVS